MIQIIDVDNNKEVALDIDSDSDNERHLAEMRFEIQTLWHQ